MTHEQIESAIERLGAYCNSTYDVMLAFMNYGNSADYGCTEFKGVLVDLLKQADPDTHIELPKDADGVPLHVGDEVYARYVDGDYYNGRVHSLEFEERFTYAYIGGDDNDLDQFATSSLHHGSHIPTVRQILVDFAIDAFHLGEDAARNNETHCTKTVDERREMVEMYASKFAPLLSDEAETGFESKCADKLREVMADE